MSQTQHTWREKHDYAKPVKQKSKHVEDFDPRSLEFRGLAAS